MNIRTILQAALGAAFLTGATLVGATPAHADSCGNAGAYGACDFNYSAYGHEHCDTGWAPFVGYINNCYWVPN